MYTEQINNVLAAINAGRTDLAQLYLSNLLLTDGHELNKDAEKELIDAVPGSKVVYGGIAGMIGMRAGYFSVEGERYYFA